MVHFWYIDSILLKVKSEIRTWTKILSFCSPWSDNLNPVREIFNFCGSMFGPKLRTVLLKKTCKSKVLIKYLEPQESSSIRSSNGQLVSKFSKIHQTLPIKRDRTLMELHSPDIPHLGGIQT